MLCVVTGVAGSGKSSLIHGSVGGARRRGGVDQGAIRGSRRSNPATYTGLLEPIRKAFAKANGVKPALFSSNSEGACPACKGAGVIFTELGVMATVESPCEECEGKRFQAAVLEYTLGGRNIAEVLAMSVAEAEEFFGDGEARTPAAHKILDRLADVGLGYLSLGQPLTTLSGGERQRLKLAAQMAEKGDVYVLDEPTTGLHLADVEQLLGLLDRLVDSGKSVIVIEHHQAVMAHADWIIDLGPGAGHDGGRIVFEGTPAELVERPVDAHRRAPGGVRRRLIRRRTGRGSLPAAAYRCAQPPGESAERPGPRRSSASLRHPSRRSPRLCSSSLGSRKTFAPLEPCCPRFSAPFVEKMLRKRSTSSTLVVANNMALSSFRPWTHRPPRGHPPLRPVSGRPHSAQSRSHSRVRWWRPARPG